MSTTLGGDELEGGNHGVQFPSGRRLHPVMIAAGELQSSLGFFWSTAVGGEKYPKRLA
ncbi:MAG TPA: hypothetical protein VF515_05160 [Candidatus Binatia bacterium]|jgi:hypothetical protein